jgi:hypothetical protein
MLIIDKLDQEGRETNLKARVQVEQERDRDEQGERERPVRRRLMGPVERVALVVLHLVVRELLLLLGRQHGLLLLLLELRLQVRVEHVRRREVILVLQLGQVTFAT